MNNLVRAGLARITKRPYTPDPTVYDGLFPDGTFITRATRLVPPRKDEPAPPSDEPTVP